MQCEIKRGRTREFVKALEITGYAGIAVAGLLIVALVVIALLPAYFSLTEWNILDPLKFVGLKNYIVMVLADESFVIALHNTIVDLLVIGFGGFSLCLLIALLLRGLPQVLRYVPIAALFVPLLCPGLLVTLKQMLQGDLHGDFNALLMSWEIIKEPVDFLSREDFIPCVVRGVQLWRSLGPGVLIISAGLDSVRPAMLREMRPRGINSHVVAFFDITLPRMRIPLILAAATMVMAALGTSKVSQDLTGILPGDSYAHLLNLYTDYGLVRYEMGYASAVIVVVQILVVHAMLLLWGAIIRLTWRSACVQRVRGVVEQEQGGLPEKWDVWRIVWLLVGTFTALCICVLSAIVLEVEVSRSLVPVEERMQYPTHLRALSPTMDNFQDAFLLMELAWVPTGKKVLNALLNAALPMVLSMGIITLIGWLLSRRSERVQRRMRVLFVAVLLLLILCSFFAVNVNRFQGHSYSEQIEFSEALVWVCWVFVPCSVAMGLSYGEIHRRKWPVRRMITAALGYVSLVVYLCMQGTLTPDMKMIDAGGIVRMCTVSAGAVLMDIPGVLLSIPIVAGLFQILVGLGDTYPLSVEGMNEQK